MLGVTISYKLIPIIVVPYLLLAEYRSTNRRRMLPISVMVCLAAAAGPFLMQQVFAGTGVYQLLWYHSSRGIQLESFYSSLMLIGSLFGFPTFVSHFHGAYELSGNLEPAMKALSTILQLVFLASLGLWALLAGNRYSRRDAYSVTLLVLAADVILSNVLSPQYFVWSIPLALLLTIELLPDRFLILYSFFAVMAVVVATTTWIFPYHYWVTAISPDGLVPLTLNQEHTVTPIAALILSVRNFAYLGAMIWLGIRLVRTMGKRDIQ